MVVISLLRGINVGGNNKIKMEELRAIYESLGLKAPQTYIQSGNVVFPATTKQLAGLSRKVQQAIEEGFGFRPEVIHRTAEEWRDAIARNPFAERSDVPPNKLYVTFMADQPHPDGIEKLATLKTNGEEIRLDGRELYIYFPNGMGQSKLPFAAIEKSMKTPGTARNWNTVLKLASMGEALIAGAV